jgi:hypothetical protein
MTIDDTFFYFVYFCGGLECVNHSFAYVAHWFLIFYEMSGIEPRELP